MINHLRKYTRCYDCLWLSIAFGIFYALLLGTRTLSVPDEARYSEMAREMLVTGHYLIPHIDGIKYFEKPDLFFWLQTLSIKLFGLHEWALRLWPVIFGILGCIITYLAGRRLFSRATGVYASIILATSALHYMMARAVTLDMAVSFFISASVISFMIATTFAMGYKRRGLIYLAAISSALAVLTKGLIGVLFPAMIIGSWIAILNKWQWFNKIYLPSALLLFLLIALPWHIMMAIAQPDWAYFYFMTQQFLRYSTMISHRYQPLGFFTLVTIVGFFPWIIFLPQAIIKAWPCWQQRYHYRYELFLLLWAGIIFVFFSLSHSKLIPYIVPLLPPLAILTANYLTSIKQPLSRAMKITLTLLPLIGIITFTIVTCVVIAQFNNPVINHASQSLLLFATLLFVTCCSSTWFCYRYSVRYGLLILTLGTAITLCSLNITYIDIDNHSIKPLAMVIKPLLTPDDYIVAYDHYYQDLPFYLRRIVVIVGWRNELSFGIAHQKLKNWLWSKTQFWQRFNQGKHRIFAIMRWHSYYQLPSHQKIYVLAKTTRNVLISNRQAKS